MSKQLNLKRAGMGIKDGLVLMGLTAAGQFIAGPVGGIAGSFLASKFAESSEVKGFAFALAAVQAGTLLGQIALGSFGSGSQQQSSMAGPQTVSNPVM